MFNPLPPQNDVVPREESHAHEDAAQSEDGIVKRIDSSGDFVRTRLAVRVVIVSILFGSMLGLLISLPLTLLSNAFRETSYLYRDYQTESFGTTFLRTFTSFTPTLIFTIALGLIGDAIIDHMRYAHSETSRQVQQLSRWLRKGSRRDFLQKPKEPASESSDEMF